MLCDVLGLLVGIGAVIAIQHVTHLQAQLRDQGWPRTRPLEWN